ncbi:MAG: PilZ domain-containing protein [Desulfobacter sp.]|nr:MAG: PilZ domain-containing protein [Desulfobacter sp.]
MGENTSINSDRSDTIRAIRKSFRVPVGPKSGISAVLGGERYPVADISPGGVRIQGMETADFETDQVIGGCELILPGDKVKRLTARLVHCSSGRNGRRGSGIEWVNMPDPDIERVAAHVSRIKQALRKTIQDQPA